MKNFTVLLGLALLSACSSDDKAGGSTSGEKVITFNDFESSAGWNVDPGMLDRGRAHSGLYAIKADKDHEFSLTFDMALGQATPAKIKTVHLEGWAFRAGNGSTGILGVQVMDAQNPGQQTFGDGIKIGEVVKTTGKWEQISKDITLPDNITAAQHIRLSLWRADGSDAVLVDDVKLSIKN